MSVVRYRAPSKITKKPCLYIIQPNQGGLFIDHYKIGRSSVVDNRMAFYSTAYPKALGGYTIFAFLETSFGLENVSSEQRAFALASKHNFERIDKKAEFFKYLGTDIHKDTKALLVETRAGRHGDITAYNKQGRATTIKGGHLNVDNIKPTPVASTRSTRIHDTYDGGRRVLRPKEALEKKMI